MIARIVFTLALLTLLVLAPWISDLIIDLGKPLALLVLLPAAFAFGTSGVTLTLERNSR